MGYWGECVVKISKCVAKISKCVAKILKCVVKVLKCVVKIPEFVVNLKCEFGMLDGTCLYATEFYYLLN